MADTNTQHLIKYRMEYIKTQSKGLFGGALDSEKQLVRIWLIVHFLDSTTTASQNLNEKLDCLGELLILEEATAVKNSRNKP